MCILWCYKFDISSTRIWHAHSHTCTTRMVWSQAPNDKTLLVTIWRLNMNYYCPGVGLCTYIDIQLPLGRYHFNPPPPPVPLSLLDASKFRFCISPMIVAWNITQWESQFGDYYSSKMCSLNRYSYLLSLHCS